MSHCQFLRRFLTSPVWATALAMASLGAVAIAQTPVQFGTHFYEFVPGYITWQNAVVAAGNRTHLGVAGYLVTITSAAENAFLAAQFGTYGSPSGAWLGGRTDSAGVGRWMVGPETGQVFSNYQTPAPGAYSTWGGIEPNDCPSFLWMNIGPGFANIATGQWADAYRGSPSSYDPVDGYIVEYEGPPWSITYAGTASPTTHGLPTIGPANGNPVIGNSAFAIAAGNLVPSGFGFLLLDIGYLGTGFPVPGAPSTLRIYVSPGAVTLRTQADAAGNTIALLPIPSVSAFTGQAIMAQMVAFDAALADPLSLGSSVGMQLRLGY